MTFGSNNVMVLTPSPREDTRRVLTAKARAMAKLQKGFSFGEGLPVTGAAITGAEHLILLATELELDADVFPNLDGGCAVAFYNGMEKVEVSISPDAHKANLTFERGIGFQYEDVVAPREDVGIEEIREIALQLRRFDNNIWKLSASSISETSTVVSGVSEISSARTPQNRSQRLLQTEEADFQSFNVLVHA